MIDFVMNMFKSKPRDMNIPSNINDDMQLHKQLLECIVSREFKYHPTSCGIYSNEVMDIDYTMADHYVYANMINVIKNIFSDFFGVMILDIYVIIISYLPQTYHSFPSTYISKSIIPKFNVELELENSNTFLTTTVKLCDYKLEYGLHIRFYINETKVRKEVLQRTYYPQTMIYEYEITEDKNMILSEEHYLNGMINFPTILFSKELKYSCVDSLTTHSVFFPSLTDFKSYFLTLDTHMLDVKINYFAIVEEKNEILVIKFGRYFTSRHLIKISKSKIITEEMYEYINTEINKAIDMIDF